MSSNESQYIYEPPSPSLNIFSGENWAKVLKMGLISIGVGIVTSVIILILAFMIGVNALTSAGEEIQQSGSLSDAAKIAEEKKNTAIMYMSVLGAVIGIASSMFALSSFEQWDGCYMRHENPNYKKQA
jgi:uncharacterized protein YqhQ